jgi:hypothetical protein
MGSHPLTDWNLMTIPLADSGQSEFQYVPVPNQHVPAVYRLLAELATSRSSAEAHVQSSDRSWQSDRIQAAFDRADQVWTEGQLARIAAGTYTSTQVLTEIMDIVAADPKWFTQNEFASATGRSLDQYRIVWAKLGPHFEKHYGTGTWPIIGFAGTQLTPPLDSSLIHFTMTPETIERWKRVRAAVEA